MFVCDWERSGGASEPPIPFGDATFLGCITVVARVNTAGGFAITTKNE